MRRVRLIAEFCQNHNGDFEVLRRMIDAAAEGGATYGKIQTIFADDLAVRPEFDSGAIDAQGRVLTIRRPRAPEHERLRKLELSYTQQSEFVRVCEAAGLVPLTTAFNLTCIPLIRDMGWRSVKVASYDCGSLPLIKALAANFDELIISTGASYEAEIAATASYLNGVEKPFSFLHCVTLYPTPLHEMNLTRMAHLRRYTTSVGLSDHSLVAEDGIKASLAALFLGADIIERHFTILPADQTRDGRVSVTTSHFKQLRAFASLRAAEQAQYLRDHVPEYDAMLGQPQRELTHEELLNRAYYRGRFVNRVNGQQIYNWDPAAEALLGMRHSGGMNA